MSKPFDRVVPGHQAPTREKLGSPYGKYINNGNDIYQLG